MEFTRSGKFSVLECENVFINEQYYTVNQNVMSANSTKDVTNVLKSNFTIVQATNLEDTKSENYVYLPQYPVKGQTHHVCLTKKNIEDDKKSTEKSHNQDVTIRTNSTKPTDTTPQNYLNGTLDGKLILNSESNECVTLVYTGVANLGWVSSQSQMSSVQIKENVSGGVITKKNKQDKDKDPGLGPNQYPTTDIGAKFLGKQHSGSLVTVDPQHSSNFILDADNLPVGWYVDFLVTRDNDGDNARNVWVHADKGGAHINDQDAGYTNSRFVGRVISISGAYNPDGYSLNLSNHLEGGGISHLNDKRAVGTSGVHIAASSGFCFIAKGRHVARTGDASSNGNSGATEGDKVRLMKYAPVDKDGARTKGSGKFVIDGVTLA